MEDFLKLEKEFNDNILNWYPFQNTDMVLEIGESGITNMLMNHCGKVISVKKDLKNISIDEKFDYIIMIGVIGNIKEIFGERIVLKDLIVFLEPHLKENGKFLIAVDNKFGLSQFSGKPDNILNARFKSLIGYSNEKETIETFTKKEIESQLGSIGYNMNFYYPLPDYKIPNVIFSEDSLPSYTTINKYMPYDEKASGTIFNEIDVFREILKDNPEMFTFFANSFLIEASKTKYPIKYKYISFNNLRKSKYRLMTKIADGYVEKQMVHQDSAEHYDQIKKNIVLLKKDNIHILEDETSDVICSRYVEQEYMLSNVLSNLLENKNFSKVEQILKQYIDLLNQNSYTTDNYEETVFKKYDVKIENMEILKELHFKENGFWDMTFKNCFYVDNDFYFFDQEWNERQLPVEYILYRSITYTISLRRFINISDWIEKYNLEKFLTIFKELDDKLQMDIKDKNVWDFFHQNKHINLDETLQEMTNMEIRSQAQQAAYDNLKAEYENYKSKVENSKCFKLYRTAKKIIKRK